jgi:IclR family transcriptional regulator, pca regulon regulatory protein
MADARSRDRVQSIERGVAVLRVFAGREGQLTTSDVATRTDLPRPVVRRILLTFEQLGYARLHKGLWSLTPRILELGSGYFAASSLPEVSYPVMNEVVERTGETCSLGVLEGGHVVHVGRVEDHRPMPGAIRIGMQLPAYATASGKTLLAHLPAEEIEEYLASVELTAMTPGTVTDPARLRERLALVRERGYDLSVEEFAPGRLAAAAPIVLDGAAVGAIAVSTTTARETEESMVQTIVPVLLEAAESIGRTYRAANPQLYRSTGSWPPPGTHGPHSR